MKCEQFLGLILDAAAGSENPWVLLERHLRTCTACTAKFDRLQRTMDLLEEWRCPEPSAYFDAQLQVRLDETRMSPKRHWWPWLRGPVLATGLTLFLAGGILMVRYMTRSSVLSIQHSDVEILPGSAVGDLQMLEEVEKASGDSDRLLDELAPQEPGVTNQN